MFVACLFFMFVSFCFYIFFIFIFVHVMFDTSVTNNHGCVPLIVSSSQSFPHSWIITGYVTRITRQVSIGEQELLTLQEHMISLPVFSGRLLFILFRLLIVVFFSDLRL